MKNKTIRICTFFSLAILLLNMVLSILQFKYWPIFESLYKSDPDSIDVAFCGSSHIYVTIDTGVLFQDFGITGFNLTSSAQPLWNTYYFIKEMLKTQRPKLLVIDSYLATSQKDYQWAGDLISGSYGMRLSLNKIENIKASDPKETWVTYFLEYPTYHSRYTNLKREDFAPNNSRNSISDGWRTTDPAIWKGFAPYLLTNPQIRPDISSITGTAPLREKSEIYLRRIIELSKEEKIPLLLIAVPYSVTPFEMQIFNRIEEIAQEYDIPFLNGNYYYDKVGLDFNADYYDAGHMNYRGSEKFTRFLGNYLKENYDFPSRQGQEGYESWKLMAQDETNQKQNIQLRETVDFMAYLQNANVEKNMVLYVARGNYKHAINYEEIKDKLLPYGINLDEAAGNTAWVTQNGKIVFAAGDNKDYCWHTDIGSFDNFTIQSVTDTSAIPDEDGAILVGAKPSPQVLAEAPVYPQVKYNTSLLETLPNGISLFVYDTATEIFVEKAGFAVTSENILSEQKQEI